MSRSKLIGVSARRPTPKESRATAEKEKLRLGEKRTGRVKMIRKLFFRRGRANNTRRSRAPFPASAPHRSAGGTISSTGKFLLAACQQSFGLRRVSLASVTAPEVATSLSDPCLGAVKLPSVNPLPTYEYPLIPQRFVRAPPRCGRCCFPARRLLTQNNEPWAGAPRAPHSYRVSG